MIRALDIILNIVMIIANIIIGLITLFFFIIINPSGEVGELTIVMVFYLYTIPILFILGSIKLIFSKSFRLSKRSKSILKGTVFLSIAYIYMLFHLSKVLYGFFILFCLIDCILLGYDLFFLKRLSKNEMNLSNQYEKK